MQNLKIINLQINKCEKIRRMRYLFLLIVVFLPVTVFGQQEIKPEGGLLAVYVFLIATAIFLLVYFAFRSKKETTHPVRLNIHMKVFYDNYSGHGSKFLYRRLEVKITNRGKTPVEIASPLIQFEKYSKKRKFKPKMQEEQRLYPLSLYPGTDHSFKIDLGKFYQKDAALQHYNKIRLLIPDMNGEIIKQHSLKI